MKKLITLIAVLLIGVSVFAQETVTSPTGKVWMDRNLGAERVAQSMTDVAAFVDLYQWGRHADGHEKRDSETTKVTTSNALPEHDMFIIGNYKTRYNWNKWDRYALWNTSNWRSENNPCPDGFRVPTKDEWVEEAATWVTLDANGAFNSVLKLPAAGIRSWNGKMYVVGKFASYWTSTPYPTKKDRSSYYFEATPYPNSANTYGTIRGYGQSVRCIKK